MVNSIFNNFTQQYALSKTLRFELKPVGNTQRMLEEEKVFQKDEVIQKKYEQTKPYFDRLHREFADEALKNVDLSGLPSYFKVYQQWIKDKKKYQKELEKREQDLRKEVIMFFDAAAKQWAEDQYVELGLKKKDIGIFFGDEVFGLLKERYGSDESTIIEDEDENSVSIFDSWKGFTGYFTKFHETRKNFYKADGTATAHATRIIDQNLKRFCNNLDVFEKIQEKIDFSEVEHNFQKPLSDVFSLEFYNSCLLQGGIDFYNKILGGETLEDGTKLKGVNELINKFRQDHKGDKIPFLQPLDKQILSEKDRFSDEIEDLEDLKDELKALLKVGKKKVKLFQSLLNHFIHNYEGYDLSEIYISKEAFNTISRKWTHFTFEFEAALYEAMKPDNPTGLKYDKTEERYKFPDFISLSYLKTALEHVKVAQNFWKEYYYKSEENPDGCLSGDENLWGQFLRILDYEVKELFNEYDSLKEGFRGLTEGELTLSPEVKVTIKQFADSLLKIYQIAKYFTLEKKREWLDDYEIGDFYKNPEFGYVFFYEDAYAEIVQRYNRLRNYLTKKPYSEDKWKLNFENSTLADGWDKNKEADNFTILLRKNGHYYLGLMKKGSNRLFSYKNQDEFMGQEKGNKYEKMVYKYLPDAAKMIPKCSTQLKSVQEHFANSSEDFVIDSKSFIKPLSISRRVYSLNNTGYDKNNINEETNDEKGGVKAFQKEYLTISGDKNRYSSALHDWIDFCKIFLKNYKSTKDFDTSGFRASKDYQSLDEFYADIDRVSYKLSFIPVNEGYVHEKNQNGELYLFEIHNKDWNLKDGKKKSGTKNLHTLYFESLFSDENIQQNFPFKLNGQAEIFHRPKTDSQQLGIKKDIKGRNVIDHKRYAEDKIFFHAPITLNRGKGDIHKFNAKINDFLANNPDINAIGVDRGEKHLAYYSVVNQKGELLRDKNGQAISGSLNFVGKDGAGKAIDYHEKLEEKAKDREQARKDWQTVEGIKDLKKGYISQVVRKLADLAIEHNAIIVFEDLNMRFKQIRGGIEKSVYQQLEKALIEKLNFLVNKGEKDPEKTGHLLKAFQLTAPFTTFKDMGKQTGILFYTQASYTSKIDPLTGWRPNLYLKYKNAEQAKADILKFSRIVFDNGRFEFTYNLKDFQKQKEYPEQTIWTVCSAVERYRWNRKLNQNKRGYDHYENITDNLRGLFDDCGIDYNSGDILGQIDSLETKGNEKFFKLFCFYFGLICQIRNTQEDKDGDDNDFILSPVAPFFDSRKADEFGDNLPHNGDENGAYNIARKGIIILKKIADFHDKYGSCEKMKWSDLYVSSKDWDDFACEK